MRSSGWNGSSRHGRTRTAGTCDDRPPEAPRNRRHLLARLRVQPRPDRRQVAPMNPLTLLTEFIGRVRHALADVDWSQVFQPDRSLVEVETDDEIPVPDLEFIADCFRAAIHELSDEQFTAAVFYECNGGT